MARYLRYVILGVVLFLSAFPSVMAQAGMYSWKDDKGKTHFTDSLHKIPPKYPREQPGIQKIQICAAR